jgi:1,4-dihydroxy-2-naphthoate octaprenyltransferase
MRAAVRAAAGRFPSPLPAARTLLGAVGRTFRLDAALASAAPVAAVSAAAWWQTGRFDIPVFAFASAAAFAAALGTHMLSEGFDRQRAAAPAVQSALQSARVELAPPPPDLTVGEIKSMGYVALLISLLCSLWLGLLVGWPMVLFGGVSLVLAWAYSAPPLRYGMVGWGLGESGLFLALGLIPSVAGYYAQARTLDPLALWSGAPFALLLSLMLFAHNLLHVRRDWLIRKRTLAVSLGLGRAIDLSTVLVIGAFAFVLLAAIVSGLPLRTMVALLALPIATGAYAQLDREQLPPTQGMRLYTAAVHATLAAAVFYCLALLTDRLW